MAEAVDGSHDAMTARRVLSAAVIGLIVGAAAASTPASAGGAGAANVVELRQSDDSLRATYAKGKRMNLPRLVVLDGQYRPLLVEIGLRQGVGHRLSRALEKDQPLDTPITIDMILREVVHADGTPFGVADLPPADGYIIDYWATWCAPCRELARDIEYQIEHAQGRRLAWLKVESDPEKLPEHGRP